VRAAFAALAVAAVAAAAAAPAGRAADECRGLMACIPVAGPWVVVPAARGVATADWQLECPRGVVAGLDARVTDRAVGVEFPGRLGSPVNPGITTTTAVVFKGRYAGTARKATSYRPFIGCIIGGGGERTRTSAFAPPLRPGQPVTTRVKTLKVPFGRLARGTHGCRAEERLIGASYAVGLYTGDDPPVGRLGSVRVVEAVRSGQILVSATRHGLPPNVRAEVQVHAECAR